MLCLCVANGKCVRILGHLHRYTKEKASWVQAPQLLRWPGGVQDPGCTVTFIPLKRMFWLARASGLGPIVEL